MKFQIKIKTLKSIIKKIASITPSISHRPELTGILIEVYDTRVVFEVRSDYLDAKVEIIDLNDISIQETGTMLVKAKIFNEIIQMMQGEFVEFTKVENNLLAIKSNDSEYEVNLMDESRFEKADFSFSPKEIQEVKISSETFKKIINKVVYSANEISSRRILQGINFIFKNNEIWTVGTDGVRIALKGESINYDGSMEKNIPIRTLKELLKLIESTTEIIMNFTNNKLTLISGNIYVQAKIIEGKYPDVISAFPKEFKNKLEIQKQELIELIDRSTLLSLNKTNDNIYIKLIIVDSLLKFESREIEIGYANISTTNHEWTGESMYQIAFNPKYMIDALKAIEDEKVEILFNDNQQPIVVKGIKDNAFKALILPFRIK